ncbi:MAG TPA: L,D-transpeptidase [Chthoniobacterales bacterium]
MPSFGPGPRRLAAAIGLALGILPGCVQKDREHRVIVSVADQAMDVYEQGRRIGRYEVSTSKFCVGDAPGGCGTPLGRLEVAKKVGDGAPLGMVFKSRKPTGERLKPDAPGRDPIVTRILWLKGLEAQNRHAFSRYIYIHGTPEERNIGHPASYGCIRMRSRDVARLFHTIGVGTEVDVVLGPLPEPSPAAAHVALNQSSPVVARP